MGYRTCHFSSLGVQGFLAEVAMGTTEIFKCPLIFEHVHDGHAFLFLNFS